MAPRKAPSSLSKSTVQNAEFRSGYGDMHAHRSVTAMAAHVADLRSRGMIGEDLAVELLKPSKNCRYSSQYLATHPHYTGEQPEMTSLVTAERHRSKRDKETERFIDNFKTGRIDEWGNDITPKSAAGAEVPAVEDLDVGSMAVKIGRDESDSENSDLTDASGSQMQLEILATSLYKASGRESSTAPLSNSPKTHERPRSNP